MQLKDITHCFCVISYNGPAIWGGCVTRRSIRAGSWYPPAGGPESCHGARRVWHVFLPSGYKFCELYEFRGTSLLGSRKQVKVYKVYCGHWRDRGISYYKSVKGAGVRAKTVTNNLAIGLSVLGFGLILYQFPVSNKWSCYTLTN